MKSSHAPIATYRLQLSGHLRFDDVRRLTGYLADLGIGAAYLSPFFHASRGSTHGYDVVDHRELDPALGTEADFARLADTLRRMGLGILVDIVPNHMGIDDSHNLWWQDVLEHGPASTFAHYFDIDWNPPKEALRDKVLLPVLGDQFGKVLEEQQILLAYDGQRFVIRYYERQFPTDPRSWVSILRRVLEFVSPVLSAEVAERMELESILSALEHLPPRNDTSPEAVAARHRESEVNRRRLSLLVESSDDVRRAVEQTLEEFNGQRGEPATFDQLEALLANQSYRLCFWRVATDEINYRRFFDVDALAAIRVEDPEVFDAIHGMVLRFVRNGWVNGLRIDHADGLLDPQHYLTHLVAAVARARHPHKAALVAAGATDELATADGTSTHSDMGEAADGAFVASAGANGAHADPADSSDRCYIVAEKILAHDESLPTDWPIDGTTGYDFLNLVNGLFVDRKGVYALRDTYARTIGHVDTFARVLYESKRTILATSLSSELFMLSHQMDRISDRHRWSRDFTRLSLNRALREVVACFPVYRTYIRPESDEVRPEDQRRIREAVRTAKRRNPAMSPAFFDFIASVLLREDPEGLSETHRDERRRFVLKFQQITPPVMAKGVEDTAFYRFYPLASLNEVGGDPTSPGTTVEEFVRRLREQMVHWPHDMRATGTHDTKRGEDMRARLNVLSEFPEEWDAAVVRWRAMNASARVELDGAAVPDTNEEYLLYQTLVGCWQVGLVPLAGATEEEKAAGQPAREEYIGRIARYVDKALREAKLHTSWLSPYEDYDHGVAQFIQTVLADLQSPFAAEVDAFVRTIADAGYVNSLAQTLLKICVPGVPDFYQGVEFWDFHLVDPDNRRPVDFESRAVALNCLKAKASDNLLSLSAELLARWPDERLKLLAIWRGLTFRREQPELFAGDLELLAAEGPRKQQVCALLRRSGTSWAVCIVPRLASAAWREISESARVDRTEGDGQTPPEAHNLAEPAKSDWPLAPWWRDTVVALPPDAPRRWRHVLSGASVKAITNSEGQLAIDLQHAFASFPVTLLAGEFD